MEEQRTAARVVSGAERNMKVIAQTSDVRIVEYTLNPGDSHPWHHHSEVTDRIYCLEGLIGVDTKQPAHQFLLQPGQSCEVPVGTIHHVSNPGAGTGRYLLVQALGRYDYIRAE
jgi:quercetin dioxygenase-like cupin family protein